jgi:hypothetical protein
VAAAMPLKAVGTLAIYATVFLIAACSQDGYRLHNPETKQEVVCKIVSSWPMPSANDMVSTSQCVQACWEAGFTSGGAVVMQPLPPRGQVKGFRPIPFPCMTEDEKKAYLDFERDAKLTAR